MELRIISPQEGGFVKEISWNNEELKKEISAKMADYRGLVFTDETIREAKKDRADLNKLKTAFEDERKRIKKLCMDPYNRFEQQVKEVIALIEEPIRMIDIQIKEVEQKKKEQKRKEIEELFSSIGFQPFVTLNQIWDEKWLNASVSMVKAEEQMRSRMYQISNDVLTIGKLQEFSFEAMEVYKKTLDLSKAIQEGQRLADIQKRKAEYEAEQRRKAEQRKAEQREAEQREAAERQRREQLKEERQHAEQEKTGEEQYAGQTPAEGSREPVQIQDPDRSDQGPKMHVIDFRVTATADQLKALKEFLTSNQIQYGPVPKEGE